MNTISPLLRHFSASKNLLRQGPLPILQKSTEPTLQTLQNNIVKPAFQHYQALSVPRIKFGLHQLLDKDYITTLEKKYPLNENQVMNTYQALTHNLNYKIGQEDASHLKLVLGPKNETDNAFSMALAGTFLFVKRPIDTVIDNMAGPASIPAILMSRLYDGHSLQKKASEHTGKIFIQPLALIRLGPVKRIVDDEGNATEAYRRIGNSHFYKRLEMFRKTTGVTDFDKAYDTLESAKEYNSLQALYFGTHGLVDAILHRDNWVLSRKGLDDFFKEKNYTDDQREIFTQSSQNLSRIPKKYFQALSEFSPQSVVSDSVKRPNAYENLMPKKNTQPIPFEVGRRAFCTFDDGLETRENSRYQGDLFNPVYPPSSLNTKVDGSIDEPPFHIQILKSQNSQDFNLDQLSEDIIYLGGEFNEKSIVPVIESIQILASKKASQENPSNIKLILDSYGGEANALATIANEMLSQTGVKTDIIVNGRAYSCGAQLLASASGNSYVTPFSEIMLHNASTSVKYESNENVNHESNNVAALTEACIALVAKVSKRPKEAVRLDYAKTTYLNPLDVICYGESGLAKGIWLGPDQDPINRKDVLNYLSTDKNAQDQISAYVKNIELMENEDSESVEQWGDEPVLEDDPKSLEDLKDDEDSPKLQDDAKFDDEKYSPEALAQKYIDLRFKYYHDPRINTVEPGKQTLFDNPYEIISTIADHKNEDDAISNNRRLYSSSSMGPSSESRDYFWHGLQSKPK